jgi:hypothetical protein
MDTKIWGPSGWKLLHSIVNNYSDEPSHLEKDNYGIFFNTLQYVLPCKYCRQSLKVFYEELPIEPFLKNKKKLSYWLYLIHNKVNKKLRDQGLNDNKNPSFKEVVKKYDEINKTNNNKDICELSYWDFLYCICFNLPPKGSIDIERKKNYILFFNYLAEVFPSEINKKLYKEYLIKNPVENNMENRRQLTHWFYNFNCFNNKNDINYTSICNKYEKIRSRCEKKGSRIGRGVKTCRVKTSITKSH